MKKFNFGDGKIFELSGENDGSGILNHNIQISPKNFRTIMRETLSESEIDEILYNCEIEDAISLSLKIKTFYDIFKNERSIASIFEENGFFELTDFLFQYSNIEEVNNSLKIISYVSNLNTSRRFSLKAKKEG